MRMAEDGFAALRRQLRDEPPAALHGLADAELADLAGAVRTAHHRQAAELAAAGEQAFNHIPRLLRGPIKKIIR
jgi:hypothetical protein